MLKMTVDSGIPFVHTHMISVSASDTVRPNATHTTTITPIISRFQSGKKIRPKVPHWYEVVRWGQQIYVSINLGGGGQFQLQILNSDKIETVGPLKRTSDQGSPVRPSEPLGPRAKWQWWHFCPPQVRHGMTRQVIPDQWQSAAQPFFDNTTRHLCQPQLHNRSF